LTAALLLFGTGLRALVLRARLRLRRPRIVSASRPYAVVCIGLAAILALRIACHGPSPFFAWAEETDEDAEAAAAYLAAVAGPGNVVYVDTSMLEPLKFYEHLTPIHGARLVPGSIGWVCCPRDSALALWTPPERTVPRELDRIFAGGVPDTLWLLYTNRPYHWQHTGVNYADLFAQSLRERSCRPVDSPQFVGVRLDGYRCAAGE
jgi:hypothetical protein